MDRIADVLGLMVTGGVAVSIVTNKTSAATIRTVMQGFADNLAVVTGRSNRR